MTRGLLALLLIGCTERGVLEVVGEPSEETSLDPTGLCANKVAEIRPAPDGLHPADAAIEVELASQDATGTVRIGVAGEEVPGQTLQDGLVLRWMPDALLPTGGVLDLRLLWACDVERAEWTVEAPVWRLRPVFDRRQLDAAPMLEGMAELVASVSAAGPDGVELRMISLDGNEVHPCVTSVDLPLDRDGTTISSPAVGSLDLVVPRGPLSVPVTVEGSLQPGLQEIRLSLAATMPVGALTLRDERWACERLQQVGWPCEPCDGETCAQVTMEVDAQLVGVDGLGVRTAEDVAAEPVCR